jgi:hypothetical protein
VSDCGMTWYYLYNDEYGNISKLRPLLEGFTPSNPPVEPVEVTQGTFIESNGVVVMEVESVPAATGWESRTNIAGYKGSAFYYWNGGNKTVGGSGTLTYKFKITTAGNYELRIRSRIAEGTSATDANDTYIWFPTGTNVANEWAISGWTKFYQNQLNAWSWSTNTKDNDPRLIRVYLSAGEHEFKLSGRSQGHALDRIVIYKYDSNTFTDAQFDALSPSSTSGTPSGGATVEMLAPNFTNKGNFYIDAANNCLAIDPATGNRQATAATKFTGAAGTYNLTIHGVGENDGRSLIKVRVGSAFTGEYRVASTTQTFATGADFNHTFSNVTVGANDTIKVQAFIDSLQINGVWEYCRARWIKVVFTPVTDLPVSIAPHRTPAMKGGSARIETGYSPMYSIAGRRLNTYDASRQMTDKRLAPGVYYFRHNNGPAVKHTIDDHRRIIVK